MSEIEIVVIFKPKPGKADRFEEIMGNFANHVKQNEPGTLRYHLQREVKGDTPTFVLLERYTDVAALRAHGSSAAFKDFGRAMKKEDLLTEPMKVISTKGVAGFDRGKL
ncbi:ABM-domain-containing protein [Trichodelitschia bisporula]|uniref:ABM-domain-containing protein n=1 Tax=Trichodelitschia bisporula TaxID=703511 RepID=A0A6G1HKU4_9PEZI|nr:ABM-domain-containing protein [Trichodelitschia bisporula]